MIPQPTVTFRPSKVKSIQELFAKLVRRSCCALFIGGTSLSDPPNVLLVEVVSTESWVVAGWFGWCDESSGVEALLGITFIIFNTEFIISRTRFIILNTKSIIVDRESIIFNENTSNLRLTFRLEALLGKNSTTNPAKSNMFNTRSNIFSTKPKHFNTKATVLPGNLRLTLIFWKVSEGE